MLQSLHHVHRAVPVFLPAVEKVVAELHAAGTIHFCILGNDAFLQRRQRHNHFESGTRRIQSGNRFVQKRTSFVGQQGIVYFGTDAVDKVVGIVRRRRHESQHFPVFRVKKNRGAAFFTVQFISLFLQSGVYRQLQPFSRHAVHPFDFLHYPAECVHFQFQVAAGAAQFFFKPFFDSVLADFKTGHFKQRIVILFQVFFRNRSHIAEQMCRPFPVWIIAAETVVDNDSRYVRRRQQDPPGFLPVKAVFDLYRHKTAVFLQILTDSLFLVLGNRQNLLHLLKRVFNAGCLLGHNHRLKILPVAGQNFAVAVDDFSPRRNQQPGRNPVFVRHGAELVRLINLQIVKPDDDQQQHRKLNANPYQRPSDQNLAFVIVAVHLFVILQKPVQNQSVETSHQRIAGKACQIGKKQQRKRQCPFMVKGKQHPFGQQTDRQQSGDSNPQNNKNAAVQIPDQIGHQKIHHQHCRQSRAERDGRSGVGNHAENKHHRQVEQVRPGNQPERRTSVPPPAARCRQFRI